MSRSYKRSIPLDIPPGLVVKGFYLEESEGEWAIRIEFENAPDKAVQISSSDRVLELYSGLVPDYKHYEIDRFRVIAFNSMHTKAEVINTDWIPEEEWEDETGDYYAKKD